MIDFEAGDLVPIANLLRNDLVESQHFGIACFVDPSGKLLAEHGNSKKIDLPAQCRETASGSCRPSRGTQINRCRIGDICG